MNAGNHGKMFQVTTLLSNSGGKDKSAAVQEHEGVDLEAFRDAIREKSKRIDELRRSDSNKEALSAAEQDLQRSKELVFMLEKQQQWTAPSAGELDFSNDFFSRPVYLSASAGLHLESYACALSSVYTIGPVFETDESKSAGKLAEMWMIEAELAFTELQVPFVALGFRRITWGLRIQELRLPHEQYEWYIDLRKHGSVKHSGFGLDIEKMVMTATGLADVKDAIPFPRVRGHAKL
ncbi:hypothetical protein BHE74_00054479 [Ensete ventricosum]|nr:hypothetical protein BHE74_00054479 [Ensete ventricosum]RZS18642.1 hypothetical protein BHM03_00050983 [Ensete ventricosum]